MRRIHLLKPILLLLFVSALTKLTPIYAAENGSELKVMTFNLRYITDVDKEEKAWTARREAAAAIFREEKADFVGVQEAFRSMIDDVKQRSPGWGEIGCGREDGQAKGEYSAILFREDRWEVVGSGTFWLSDTPEVVASATWGNKVTRICTWGRFKARSGGKELAVFNAHYDHQSQPAREKSSELILQRMAKVVTTLPTIFMGDLNADPANKAITLLTAETSQLKDVWKVVHGAKVPPLPGATFHAYQGGEGKSRIDYIFANEKLRPLSIDILRNCSPEGHYPSDHYPVRASLAWR